jgi:lactoylglutathione lyase
MRDANIVVGDWKMKTKFAYTGIRVKDLEKSLEFYTKVLGMRVVSRTKIEAAKGEVVNLTTEDNGQVLELNFYSSDSEYNTKYEVGEGIDHLAFQVDDLDKAASEAEKAGFPVFLRMKTESSRWAYIKDPNGIYIELFA